jgi:hypothetical protein
MNISQLIERKDIEPLPEKNFLKKQFNEAVKNIKFEGIKILNIINEFYIDSPKQVIKHLAEKFINYYKFHRTKKIIFIKDKHGDIARNTVKSWNNEFMDYCKKAGWKFTIMQHPGQEPPHSVVYKFINDVLHENFVSKYPIIRINADKCKNTLISMKNTKVEDKTKGLRKVKNSEHINSGVEPRHATHFSDSINKLVYTYLPRIGSGNSSLPIPTRLSK